MCLAILMYLVTGTLALLWHLAMTVGIFLMTLLGKAILFVCASIYTVARPIAHPPDESQSSGEDASTARPFVTMYPEIGNFDEDYDTMARVSLETVTSAENSPRQTHHPSSSASASSEQHARSERIRPDVRKERIRPDVRKERTTDNGKTEARLQRGSRQPRQVNK